MIDLNTEIRERDWLKTRHVTCDKIQCQSDLGTIAFSIRIYSCKNT